MKLKSDTGELSIETENGNFEICNREDGLVINPERKHENTMSICILNGAKKTFFKGNIMWIKIKKEKT